MSTKKIRLTHNSGHPEASGEIGEEIECDAAIADRFIAGGGAVEVEAVVEAPAPTTKKKRTKKVTEKAE